MDFELLGITMYLFTALFLAFGGLYIMNNFYDTNKYWAMPVFAFSIFFCFVGFIQMDERLQLLEEDLTLEIAQKLNADVNEIIVKDDTENGSLKTVYYDGKVYIFELKDSHVEKFVLSE